MKRLLLSEHFNSVAKRYITAFVKKQGYQFTGWVADDIGGVAEFAGEYFFSFNDIRLDINHNAPNHLIFEWQEECINEAGEFVNYYSYINGARLTERPSNTSTTAPGGVILSLPIANPGETESC